MAPSLFEEKLKFQKEIATENPPMDGTFTPSNKDMNKALLFPKKKALDASCGSSQPSHHCFN
jgi:hypothetical protein